MVIGLLVSLSESVCGFFFDQMNSKIFFSILDEEKEEGELSEELDSSELEVEIIYLCAPDLACNNVCLCALDLNLACNKISFSLSDVIII